MNINKKALVLLLVSCSLIYGESESQRNIDQSIQVKEQEQQRIEQEKKLQELENSQNIINEKKVDAPVVESEGPKFLINEIKILDRKRLLRKYQKKKILKKYQGRELSSKDLTLLLTDLTNQVITNSYITSSVNISEGNDLSTGVLNLEVVPGTIENVVINDGKINDKYKEFFMFGTNRGDVLSIRKIDTVTENFNLLRSNDAKITIEAGSKKDTSVVKVSNTMKDRVVLSFKGNNFGQTEQSGIWRYGIGLNVESPLGMGDNLNLSYVRVDKRTPDRSWRKKINELAPGEILENTPKGWDVNEKLPYQRRTDLIDIAYTIPIKTYRLSFASNTSLNNGSIYAFNTVFDTINTTRQLSFGIDKILYRNQKSKIMLNLNFTRKHTESYFEDAELTNRKLSVGSVGLSYSTVVFKGLLNTSLSYQRGTKLWSAEKDDNKTEKNSKSEYQKYNFNLSYYKPLTKKIALRFNTTGSVPFV